MTIRTRYQGSSRHKNGVLDLHADRVNIYNYRDLTLFFVVKVINF